MAAYNGGSPVDVTLPEEGEDFYPIRAGAIEGCVEYEAVVPPMTCQSFLDRNQITIAQFYKMSVVKNPQPFSSPPYLIFSHFKIANLQ